MRNTILDSLINYSGNTFEKSDSIGKHLTLLLNSRRGALAHLPEYGLPDITNIYQNLPHSIHGFVESIRKTIMQYEPRLQNVKVHPLPIYQEDCIIRIKITGTVIFGELLQFESYFMSGGGVKLKEFLDNKEINHA